MRDHLGNNRVVANASGGIVQSTQYYPFGMAFAEGSGTEQGKQPYKYNGKELDRTHELNWYDYSARQMDNAYGRFTSVDPLAEKYYSISPYAYVMNNPMRFIDPTGMAYDDYYNENAKYLGTDHSNTNKLRVISSKDWNQIQQTKDFPYTGGNAELQLKANSKVISVENAGSKFEKLWNSSISSGVETAAQITFNFKKAELSLEVVNVGNAGSEGGYVSGKAGDKFKDGESIILGNVHTHPTEHTYLGQTSAETKRPITDSDNFKNQYSTPNSDGNRAANWQGANYTISKSNVDYFSPQGKSSSVNNITTRSDLNQNKFNLLNHALRQYNNQ